MTARRRVGAVADAALQRSPERWISRARRRHPDWPYVDDRTDVVVEGFPGSGNTWVRESLLVARPGLRVASHVHEAAQVRAAVARGLPVLLLVRDPVDAVTSMLGRRVTRGPDEWLRRSTAFHRAVRPLAGRLLVVGFERATADLPAVLAEWARRGGPDLEAADPEAVRQKIRSTDERLLGLEAGRSGALPSSEREARRRRARAEVLHPSRSGRVRAARRAVRDLRERADALGVLLG